MKQHLQSHRKACVFCKMLFNLIILASHIITCPLNPNCINNYATPIEMTPIDQPSCSYNVYEGPLKKKARMMKEKINELKSLDNEEIKLITQPEKLSLIESKQKDLNTIPSLEILKPWQQSVLNILSEENYDNRTINVLLDKKGGIGKTTLKKYCEKFDNYLTITGYSKTNVLYAYRKLSDNLNKNFWSIIIDIPRSTNFLPSFIEEIKDNSFPSWNNYQPPLKISKNSIFIFTNNEQLLRGLSKDRLKVYSINAKDNLEITNIYFEKNKISLTNSTMLRKYISGDISFCNDKCLMCEKCKKCLDHNQCICHIVCTGCETQFVTKSNLNRHIRKNQCTKKIKKLNINDNKRLNINLDKSVNITTNHNYINTCKICKKNCDNFVCEECKYQTSESDVKCKYCEFYIKPSYMFDHLLKEHIEHVCSPLLQFDMCM